ncbi:MAG TPA: hypothetical protein VFK06_03005 [Candidatus Angelobacter sp.]|nr:hypothetical protein [Candidatus Angelobacter sp.]
MNKLRLVLLLGLSLVLNSFALAVFDGNHENDYSKHHRHHHKHKKHHTAVNDRDERWL